eukprot:g5599.t1
MTGSNKQELSRLLDEDDSSRRLTFNGDTSTDNLLENGRHNEHVEQAIYEEHAARVKAEAEAEESSKKLAVAQTQLTEYSLQKSSDVDALEKETDLLNQLFIQITNSNNFDTELMSQLKEQMDSIRTRIADISGEAKAFAMQQKADLQQSQGVITQISALPKSSPNGEDSELVEELSSDMDTSEADSDDESDEEHDGLLLNGAPKPEPFLNGSNNNHHFTNSSNTGSSFLQRSKYIPLRLNYDERSLLRLLEAALNVSEYTDKVDILSYRSPASRVQVQIKRICSILSGLVVAEDYKKGQQLVKSRNFADNAVFFQDIFEIGRRFKIMNPDKMRSEYGKLIYMLMDSADHQVQELLEFDCVRPLRTVYSTLKNHDLLTMLDDPLMESATAEIVTGNRPRNEIQRAIRSKERARECLVRKYSNGRISEETLLLCLYSISDNNSFLLYNRDPIDKMISYLHKFFDPKKSSSISSLAIVMGSDGARLTHSHERQYQYVLQTLTLWREISNDMFKLWYLAESDLLSKLNGYRLQDTGQGLNRVQQSPQIRKVVFDIIHRCRTKIGHWVGSSVVHLGDHNVPNALMFIDKYTQVPRILNPIVLVLEEIPKLYSDRSVKFYINQAFGGIEACQVVILRDFFRHAFDGSGADNFFDAGSCIDGRLTSAWNWCSKVEKKPYYHIFKIAGFVGFDGDFQK